MAALYNLLLFIPTLLLLFNFYAMTNCFTSKVFTHIFAFSRKCFAILLLPSNVMLITVSSLYQWFLILSAIGLSCKFLKKYRCQDSTWKF